ncbi:hypothetical protein [Roseateles sp.]|jgi:hypothetical protein|uniref:hypothetical protein n=1 Tax=Roseateles sp. TaxID=1971397 RepID=UPI0031DA6913
MSNASPRPSAALKSALESAFIALLASGACLWFLISDSQMDDVDPARAAMFGIGLFCALVAHWVYMGLALKRAGRGVVLWMIALVCLVPFSSVVLGILLFNQAQEMELQAQEKGGASAA